MSLNLRPQTPNKPKQVVNKLEKNDVLIERYCASELSLPKNAINITCLCPKNNVSFDPTYNKLTGLPFGFSYFIAKSESAKSNLRIIERDIAKTGDYYDINLDYENMKKYYSDEIFPAKNINKKYLFDYDQDYDKCSSDSESELGSIGQSPPYYTPSPPWKNEAIYRYPSPSDENDVDIDTYHDDEIEEFIWADT